MEAVMLDARSKQPSFFDTDQGIMPGFAKIGLAFDVETIRETIELLFEEYA